MNVRRWMLTLVIAVPVALASVYATRAREAWKSRSLHWDLDLTFGGGSLGAQHVVTFLPDGRTLLTASEDERIRMWDTGGTRLLRAIPLNKSPQRSGLHRAGQPLAVAPDGRTLITGYPTNVVQKLIAWDVNTGALKWCVSQPAWSVAFAPDSQTLACVQILKDTPTGASRVILLDTATGTSVRAQLTTPSLTRAAAFSPDGKTLATAGEYPPTPHGGGYRAGAGEVRLWRVSDGKLVGSLPPLPSRVSALAFAPDGKTLAVGGAAVTVWNFASGQLVHRLRGMVTGRHGGESLQEVPAHHLAYSPDGRFLAGAGFRRVHVWEAPTGEWVRTLRLLNAPGTVGDPDVGEIVFSREGNLLAASSLRVRSVTLWRTR